MAAEGLPPYLYTHLIRQASEKVEEMLLKMKRDLINVLIATLEDSGITDLPSVNDVLAARNRHESVETPCWDVTKVMRCRLQSQESYDEQKEALVMGYNALYQYVDISLDYCPHSVCIVGDPGAGKTTVLLMIALQAMCMGLCGLTMALLCERALQLGGKHLHWLLHLVIKGTSATAAEIADNTIAALYRDGFRLELI
jgi:ABC-type ATPase with predicted acetyltransferase domain